jgi:PTH1 family peptidyl-tRNA hydrolase
MKLIIGLGNPGRDYERTRHNVGFMAIDRLAEVMGIDVVEKKFKAFIGQGQLLGEKVVLAKPQTFMNLSGDSVSALLNWYKLSEADLLVIYDDLDLPCGRLRLRPGGGTGGHRGMESIIIAIGQDQFTRLRIGIGKPPIAEFDAAHYVLGRFGPAEEELLRETLDLVVEAVGCIIKEGVEKTMNLYNRKIKPTVETKEVDS